ncbi:MAG: zf-TFIIB domain-containing protein [Gammaproteobacteria bacterium]|nr:zf-TFIIB domain-containing protein [Gammaproteobacteria bacterium]
MSTTDDRENRWFRENERKLLEDVRREREQRLKAYRQETEKEQRDRLRQEHWMRCPKCGNEMETEQLEGIDIERCSVCGGMFFEHSELQTLLMRKQESRFKFYRNIFGLD